MRKLAREVPIASHVAEFAARIVLATHPGKEGSAHLLTLARLSRLLGRPEFRTRLMEVESIDELFRSVEEAEARR